MRGTPASSKPAAVRTKSGQTVFGGSLATSSRRGSDAAGGLAATGPPGRASAAKLWDGLKAKKGAPGRGGDPAKKAPLNLKDSDLPDAEPAGSPLVIGMVLLAVGSVAMFAGFTVAALRRRRAPAAGGRWPLS